MNVRRFALLIGIGLGAVAVVLVRRGRAEAHDVSSADLAESLRDQLAVLENKIERVLRPRA